MTGWSARWCRRAGRVGRAASGRRGTRCAPARNRSGRWVRGGLTTVKICDLLAREGTAVPYRTLARFVAERCEGGRSRATVRVDDGEPGAECQLDFARMGLVSDPGAGRRRLAHALIFTAVFSRHMFVYFTFAQTLEAVLAGCEQAWEFFGGVFRVLIPDNLSPVVAAADPVHPRFTVGWLDYAQARGFVTDPARVATPTDKPRVERNVTYVRVRCSPGRRLWTWPTPRPARGCGVRRPRGCAAARDHAGTAGRGVRRAGGEPAAARPGGAVRGADLRHGARTPRSPHQDRQGAVLAAHAT